MSSYYCVKLNFSPPGASEKKHTSELPHLNEVINACIPLPLPSPPSSAPTSPSEGQGSWGIYPPAPILVIGVAWESPEAELQIPAVESWLSEGNTAWWKERGLWRCLLKPQFRALSFPVTLSFLTCCTGANIPHLYPRTVRRVLWGKMYWGFINWKVPSTWERIYFWRGPV
jgi:hypothetical protein